MSIDEVITNLDSNNSEKILDVLEIIGHKNRNFSYINCSHNKDLLNKTCDEIIVI